MDGTAGAAAMNVSGDESPPLPPQMMPPPSPPSPPSIPPPPPPIAGDPVPPPTISHPSVSAAVMNGHDMQRPGSNFSSPLPPCPEDLPAPPPPSCTPPKYDPVDETENTEEEGEDDDSAVSAESLQRDSTTDAMAVDEQNGYPTPPPPPSPPQASPPPVAMGTPPPPPPPPFSPPSAKHPPVPADSPEKKRSTRLDRAQEDRDDDMGADNGGNDKGDDEDNSAMDGDVEPDGDLDITGDDGLAVEDDKRAAIAMMRSAASEREIMAVEPARETAAESTRWYLGDIDNYSIIDKVGSGTYGEVFKCQHKVSKDIVALKKMRPDVEKNGFPVTSIREMKILKFLKHPNIVALKEIVSSNAPPKEGKRPPLYFAFEYMEHDLSGLLNHPRVKFSRTQIQCYMRQLLCGVAFMHRNKIIHRDIKASNLLLNNQGMLKVADFGLSRFYNEVNAKAGRYTNKVVTLWYRPPELLMGSTSYDFSVDIWSVGCIFGELLLGKPILQGKTEIEQLKLIFGLCGKPTEELWPGYKKLPGAQNFEVEEKYVCPLRDRFKNFPPHAIDLLEKLLTLDPAKRMTAAEALDHDYFWRVLTCKPRDLPKFCVASTHEYQSKKRHHEDMAAATAAGNGNAHEQHRHSRGRRDRHDHYRGHHDRSQHHHHSSGYHGRGGSHGDRPRYRHRDSGEYFDRDRDRDHHRDRSRDGERDHHGSRRHGDSRSRA